MFHCVFFKTFNDFSGTQDTTVFPSLVQPLVCAFVLLKQFQIPIISPQLPLLTVTLISPKQLGLTLLFCFSLCLCSLSLPLFLCVSGQI